ncbi:MAG: hypothetical protein NHG36_01310 [Chromatiaceae bacterium]|nr:hypothetical protein [Candidatus Thioaporhodococcus sediminis]
MCLDHPQVDVQHRSHGPYAFVVSRNFAETAGALRDRLVAGAGFNRRDVNAFVTAAKSEQARLDLEGHAGRVVVHPVAISLSEKPDFKSVPKPVRDYPWDLSTYEAAPTGDDITALGAGLKVSEGGEIDIDGASGKVVSRFLPDLQRDLRGQAVRKSFQRVLFSDDAASRVALTDQHAFEFHAQAYAPSRDYDGRFGLFDFRQPNVPQD